MVVGLPGFRKDLDYQRIKKLAKELRCRVPDLIALAPQNDPFYIGRDSQLRLAEWFRGLWDRFGYVSGVHLRRVHYRIISQAQPVLLPNGKPYENTLNCWDELDKASKYARYLGLVDPGAFVDRRNAEPLIFTEELLPSSPDIEIHTATDLPVDGFTLPDIPDLPEYKTNGFFVDQPFHLEVWCEKSTMNATEWEDATA